MSTILLISHLVLPIAASESIDEPSGYTLPVDIAILGLGTLGYLGVHQIPINIDTPRATPTGIDAWYEPQWNPKWKTASDFLGTPYANYGFNLPVLTLASVGIWGLQSQNSLSPAMPVAQSVAVTAALTELTKRLVARPRPYTSEAFEQKYPEIYASDEMIALRQDNDTYKSFPSGHTSNAAATYFTSAAIIAAYYDDPTIDIVSYTMASILTGITGYSRVRYGKHNVSDTLVGAALGTSIGLGIAQWHIHREHSF
jgi:membrane-associated phospholipid phosphatase